MTRATDGVRQVETARPVDVEEMATVAHHVLVDVEASHMAMAVAEAIAKHLATPVPEIAAGTAGTATALHTSNVHGFCHLAGPGIDGTFAFTSDEGVTVPWSDVSAFVPDASPEEPRAGSGDAYRSIRWDGDEWYNVAGLDYWRNVDAREHTAEVERLRAQLASLGEDRNALALRLDRLSVDSVREAIRTALRDELYSPLPEEIADEAVRRVLRIVADDEPEAAPEPRPAFVLPERRALAEVARIYFGGEIEAWYEFADAGLLLLAEHAVTEDRLRDALESALMLDQRDPLDQRVEETREVLGHLTGKAS